MGVDPITGGLLLLSAGVGAYESGQARREARSESERQRKSTKNLLSKEERERSRTAETIAARRTTPTMTQPRDTILTSPTGATSDVFQRKTLLGV